MPDGIYTALSGAVAQDYRMENISNNLANMSTPGFKEEKVAFKEVLAQHVIQNGKEELKATKMAEMGIDPTTGALIPTDNPFDFALEGSGFFNVQTPEGVQYTRQGIFDISTDGKLVTSEGYPVLGERGPIDIPYMSNITVDEDGSIFADMDYLDNFRITTFPNPEELIPRGHNMYLGAGAIPDKETLVLQGFVEDSNVNATMNMVDLIQTSKIFEVTNKAIKAYQELDKRLIRLASR